MPGRVGEETRPGGLSLLVWEGVCVPHVNACAGWPTGSPGYGCGWEWRCVFAASSATVCSANTVAFIQELNHKGIICK